jgi:CRISPR-associated endonuclease Cas2
VKETFVVIYDVTALDEYNGAWNSEDYKRRCKIARLLLLKGERVQRSVFEVSLTKSEKSELTKKLKAVSSKEDKIFIYLIEKKVKNKKIILGTPLSPPDILII